MLLQILSRDELEKEAIVLTGEFKEYKKDKKIEVKGDESINKGHTHMEINYPLK